MIDDKSKQKDLNDLLPSNILSEVDADSEGSQGYVDNDDEIVDVIILITLLGLSLPPKAGKDPLQAANPLFDRPQSQILLRQQRPDVPKVPTSQAQTAIICEFELYDESNVL